MNRNTRAIFIILSLSLCSACKALQPDTKKSVPVFQAAEAAAGSDATQKPSGNTPPASTPQLALPVQAKLAGYPDAKSPNNQIEISVTAVAEYKWKLEDSTTECQFSADYSSYVPVSTPIKLDLSDRKESPAIIVICVVGKSSSGEEQSLATLASWVWSPETPTITDQLDLLEGNNEVKITPKAPSGTWMIIRSKDALTALPEDGKTYTANQALGNGIVMVAGPMAEFIDKTVKNEESWNYTFLAFNAAKRFSGPLRKSLTLTKQELLWVPNGSIQTAQVPLEARAANKRYVCRSRHTDATTGQTRGTQPGSMVTANNDLKNGQCFYEYSGTVFRSINYDLLMASKGNPTDLVRWARGLANTTTTSIPNGSIIAGTDDTGATIGPNLYICLSLNAQISGKAGTHMANGCRSYVGNNNGTPSVNPNFDVLAFK